MIYYSLLGALAIFFFELFLFLRVGRDAARIVTCSSESAHILMSAGLGDDEKEAAMRRRSLEIFKATSLLGGKLFLICLILYLLFKLLAAEYPDFREVALDSLFSPVAVTAITVAIVCYTRVRKSILSRI